MVRRWPLPLSLLAMACSGGSSSPEVDAAASDASTLDASAPDAPGATFDLAIACQDAIDDVYTLPAGTTLDSVSRGQMLRCAKETTLSVAQVNAAATALDYAGTPLPSGMAVYRIAYGTRRSDADDGSERRSVTTARVFLPDTP